MSCFYLGFKSQYCRFSLGFLIPASGSSQPVLQLPLLGQRESLMLVMETQKYSVYFVSGRGRKKVLQLSLCTQMFIIGFLEEGDETFLVLLIHYTLGNSLFEACEFEFCKYLEMQFAR